MSWKSSLFTLLGLPVLAACGTTIQPGQLGLKYIALDEPALEKEVRPEGFYFQWAWNGIVTYDVTWQSRNEKLEILTADDLHVPVTVTVIYRPKAEQLYDLHTKIGPAYYEEIIQPAFLTIARTEFAKHRHNDLARVSRAIENEALTQLRTQIQGKPIEIETITVTHIEFDKAVTKSIANKLVKEQQSEQKKYELEIAKQDAEIARTAARGVSDATRIRAEGEAQATVIKGQAQANAQDAITKTLTKSYLQYKAFDNDAAVYYFVPIGKDGLPVIVNAEPGRKRPIDLTSMR